MANTLKVTPEDLLSRANEFKAQADIVADVNKKMSDLVGCLAGEWEGDASRKYQDLYLNQLKGQFENAANQIYGIYETLKRTSENYAKADEVSGSQFKN